MQKASSSVNLDQSETVNPVSPLENDTPKNEIVQDEAPPTEPPQPRPAGTIHGDLINVARGFCMGAADTVPGVSGGTVALILGHYERLVSAIGRIGPTTIKLLLSRRLVDAWHHVDGRFLAALGFGIVSGVVCLAGLMNWLLVARTSETFAVFFGLIIASAWIVMRYVDRWSPTRLIACALAIGVAVGITFCSPATGSTSLAYLFFSASIAICAMILPGISGAFVMLLFGVYGPVTGMIKNAAKGDVGLESLVQMAAFGFGCLFGLLAFSRFLRWLLKHHQGTTMAALTGLMLGSIGKLWPLQVPTAETAMLEMKERVMVFHSPATWEGTTIALLFVLAVAAAAAVLVLDRVGSRLSEDSDASLASS